MKRWTRHAMGAGPGSMALLLVTGGAWILSPTPAPTAGAVSPIMRQEVDAAIAALTPRKRSRPLIAIIGINDATEPGWVRLYPALKVVPDATVAEFDARHPDGADYVVVPAMSRDDDPTILPWIKSQAAKGAMVIGVCAGAKVVGEAGLLDGTRATTHWYHLDEVRRKPHDPYRSGSEVRGRQGRCNDDRDHGVHADDAHRDRGHRRAAQGRVRRAGSRPSRMGRGSRQRRVQVHSAVRHDGDGQYARGLES